MHKKTHTRGRITTIIVDEAGLKVCIPQTAYEQLPVLKGLPVTFFACG